ncbi:hypothetical protein NCC49_004477 [Naganishia albida]|nr:hypothetical protein NCC49_004477 [Naganishia albida]
MDALHARVQALARQVDRLRQRADELDMEAASQPTRRWSRSSGGTVPDARKQGSASAEMHASPGERRRARLAALRSGDHPAMAITGERSSRESTETIVPRNSTSSSGSRTPRTRSTGADPSMTSASSSSSSTANALAPRDTPTGAYEAVQRLRQRAAEVQSRATLPTERRTRVVPVIVVDDPVPAGRDAIAIGPITGFASAVVARNPVLEGEADAPTRRRAFGRGTVVDPGGTMRADDVALVEEREGMTTRGRRVAERARREREAVAHGTEETEATAGGERAFVQSRMSAEAPARAAARAGRATTAAEQSPSSSSSSSAFASASAWSSREMGDDARRRPRLADLIHAHRLEVETEFPTPAEAARTGLLDRVRRLADSASASAIR